MKKSSFIIGAIMGVALTVTSTAALTLMPDPFKDIPEDHWALFAVEWAKNFEIMKGYEDETFRGDNSTTRYELAMVLSNYDDMVRDSLNARKEEIVEMEKRIMEYNAYNFDPFPILDQEDILEGAELYKICKSKEDGSRLYLITSPIPNTPYQFFDYKGMETHATDFEGCLITTKEYFDSKVTE